VFLEYEPLRVPSFAPEPGRLRLARHMESETLEEAYKALERSQKRFPLYEMAEGARRPRRVDVMLESMGTGGYCERLRLLSRDAATA